MKEVFATELADAVPLEQAAPPVMTRKEKLLHWASLIRKLDPLGLLSIFHGLEYYNQAALENPLFVVNSQTAFGLAAMDPTFKAQGLTVSHAEHQAGPVGSARDIMNFFELSQAQLHEFSCDCGGEIRNADMADRIERLANG